MFVLRERLKPASELKSVSCGNTYQMVPCLVTLTDLKKHRAGLSASVSFLLYVYYF